MILVGYISVGCLKHLFTLRGKTLHGQCFSGEEEIKGDRKVRHKMIQRLPA